MYVGNCPPTPLQPNIDTAHLGQSFGLRGGSLYKRILY